jgi:hypothetical protein
VKRSLPERSYWLAAICLLTLSAVFLDVGWTSPFAFQLFSQLGIAWLSLPLVDAILSVGAIVCFILGLWLLTRTKDPTLSLSKQ